MSKPRRPTENDFDMPTSDLDDFDFDAPEVIAVREDEGQSPEVIQQCFQLRVRYASVGFVSFRLLPVPNSMTTKTTAWLQIRANCIESLDKMLYDKANTDSPSPPYLEAVRRRLNGMQSVTRLQFQLHRDGHIDLVTPVDSDAEDILGEPVSKTGAPLMSLATASRFSMYFRHDILRRKTFLKYKRAIRDFPHLTENEKNAYECMVDVRRLYHGAGGQVHRPHGHRDSPSTKELRSSPAPATPASCGSTLPFEDVPQDRSLPPPYDECLSEGRSPKIRSDAAPIVAEWSRCNCERDRDCDPQEYGETERRNTALESSQGVLPFGDADIHTKRIQRKRSGTTVCTTTSPKDAPRPDKLQRTLFADLDGPLMRALERQQQQINDLQHIIKESQKRNEELELRCDELEKKCSELEDVQSANVETVENLDIAVDGLQARCDSLEKQMPDVCDEMADLKEKWLEECREELEENERKSSEDSKARQIREGVEAEVNQIRRRVLRALQPTSANEGVKVK
ncbi:hypothetical protein BDP81DRAFT_423926 [Colletotrichum phormii]|uniref:Uncharacterized protein n=1 Tax=Colletotrichum phormii TaxID=359342 RepID=A0AAJ0EFB8_9PEZI|nr:uncharacterized protein BDP81DRAFT_423926 [Colletotrichum phormii]KAK1638017.1 hypothetical protein BDP81DRAFT_423926 [Colletotrichum phormii]